MKHKFKAEVKQVLDIVVNSLYTDKEIFIRELVSNASDASEKLRFNKLSANENFDVETLKIVLDSDEKEGVFSIEDFGIGMTEKELVENLGTIAHSGSKAFLKALEESGGKLSDSLIGQFGVGFYSVFMVAKKVDVYTKADAPDAKSLHWSCDGSENFTIEECDKQSRGTKIVATLKDEFKDFSKTSRIKSIVEKYSAYIEFPIYLGEEKLNTMSAIWTKSKSEISSEQYVDFYKFQAHAFSAPLDWLHFKADAPLELNALIYVPDENTERFGLGKSECGVALYCKKVLIDPKPRGLFPDWMRFASGVIDSSDIPLNISRESMQDSGLVKKLGKVVLKRFIKHLEKLAKTDSEKFSQFWKKFGVYIKEGCATDFENRTELAKLLRFESSLFEEHVSLGEYVSRMKESQDKIFYAQAPNRKTAEALPALEAFKARGIEVLFVYENIDSFVLGNMGEFEGKKFAGIDDATIELEDAPAENDETALSEEELKSFSEWAQEILKDEGVDEIRTKGRLVDSPAAVLNADAMNPQMRALLKAMNPEVEMPKPVLKFEINPRNETVKNISNIKKTDEKLAKLLLEQLFDNARLSAGVLENPQKMANRLNEILSLVKP